MFENQARHCVLQKDSWSVLKRKKNIHSFWRVVDGRVHMKKKILWIEQKSMGISWYGNSMGPAYHKGVPFLGVPGITLAIRSYKHYDAV